MTVPSSSNRMEYTGNGVASVFDYTFQIFDNTDLRVYVLDTDGVQTQLVLTTDFTVTGAGDPDGGSITLVAGALTTDYELTILREVPLTQEVDLRNQGAYYPETVETMGDRLMMGIQQIAERVTRTLQFRPSDDRTTAPKTNQLPVPQTGYALSWDADGNLENVQLAAINYDIIITSGDAGKVIKVNATEDGIDVGVTYTDANTVSTIIQRDASGRAKVSSPSAAQDIANKDYVDNVSIATANIQDEAVTASKLGSDVPVPVLLSETAFTEVASVDLASIFSDNPGFSYYMVEVDGAGTNQPDKDIILRVSIDGSTFRSTAGDYAVGGQAVQLGDNITTAFRLFAKVVFFAPSSTTAVCPIAGESVKTPLTATVAPTYLAIQDAFIATLDDVTGIQIAAEAGLLRAEGSLRVYGSNTPF